MKKSILGLMVLLLGVLLISCTPENQIDDKEEYQSCCDEGGSNPPPPPPGGGNG